MKVIKSYSSLDDQPNFKNRDFNKQKKVIFDIDKMPDNEEDVKSKWSKKRKRKTK